eukprot:TRINITY_DN15121_c0_g1_i1.p1 TRINITY_DN15121_c0_g1~~TRINITY_DN15121_c0_g1_i1.p1  ORF type:complete len:1344 (+),score=328.15 TRINITY_DN15121_c0_g1_i1:78-4109(+)
MYTVDISAGYGQIWLRRPNETPSGLLSIIKNGSDATASHFTDVAFNTSGDSFVLVDRRGMVSVFHVLQNRYAAIKRGGAAGTAIAFSTSRSNEIVLGLVDGQLQCFNTNSKALVGTMKGHGKAVRKISFHPYNPTCVTTSSDTVYLWDTQNYVRRRALSGGQVGIRYAIFTPAGDAIITLLKDDSVILWDSATFKLRTQLHQPPLPAGDHLNLHTLAVSPDGRYLIGAGQSTFILLWDLAADALVRVVQPPSPCKGVMHAEFMHDCQTCAMLFDDGIIRFVDVVTMKVSFQLTTNSVALSFALHPASKYAVVICNDATVQLFDLDVARSGYQAACQARLSAGFHPRNVYTYLKARSIIGGEGLSILSNQRTQSPVSDALDEEDVVPRAAPVPVAAVERDAPAARRVDVHAQRKASSSQEFLRHVAAPAGLPPFQVADLTPEARAENRHQLQQYLRRHGEYPESYRVLVWRFMLQLPNNTSEYQLLAARGVHPAFADLPAQYPVKDGRLLKRLQRLMSTLAHWAPVCGEMPYLPAFVFPLVGLFDHDAVSRFEMVATLLTNWCSNWFEFFPHPPFGTLNIVDSLLQHHCPKLLAHFQKLNVIAQVYAWLPLQTLFSEMLTKFDWLRLFDHILSNDTSFMVYAATALVIYFRKRLLTVQSVDDCVYFFRRQNPMEIGDVISLAYRLQRDTPPDVGPPIVELIPLPRSAYPVFNKYPTYVVDYQAKERERIRLEEEEYLRKQRTLSDVQKEVERLARDEQAWRLQHEQLKAQEGVRRSQAQADEELRLKEMRRLDENTRSQRLQYLQTLAQTRHDAMQKMAEMGEIELKRLEEQIQQARAKEEYAIERRMEEEAMNAAELQARRQAQEHELEKHRDSTSRHLRAQFDAKLRERDLALQSQEQAWKLEDERRQTQQQELQKQQELANMLTEQVRIKRELENKLQLEDAQRKLKLDEIEHQRQMQLLQEDVMNSLQMKQSAQAKEAELLDAQASQQRSVAQKQAELARVRASNERQRIIEGVHREVKEEEQHRTQRLKELAQRQLELKQLEEQTKLEMEAEQAAVRQERELQVELQQVEAQRKKDIQTELELAQKESQLQRDAQHLSNLRRAEESAAQRERQRLQQQHPTVPSVSAADVATSLTKDSEQQLEQHRRALLRLDETYSAQLAAVDAYLSERDPLVRPLAASSLTRSRDSTAEKDDEFVRQMVAQAEARLAGAVPQPKRTTTKPKRPAAPRGTSQSPSPLRPAQRKPTTRQAHSAGVSQPQQRSYQTTSTAHSTTTTTNAQMRAQSQSRSWTIPVSPAGGLNEADGESDAESLHGGTLSSDEQWQEAEAAALGFSDESLGT